MQQASFGASPVSWSLYRGQRGGTRGRGSKYRPPYAAKRLAMEPRAADENEQRTGPVETNQDGAVLRAGVDRIADSRVEMLWHDGEERRSWWLRARTRRNATHSPPLSRFPSSLQVQRNPSLLRLTLYKRR
jgi:hypothetical protein